MHITLEELEKWEVEEVKFIEGKEPEGNVHAIAYIELLEDYCNAR